MQCFKDRINEKLKFISILYTPAIESVKRMIQEHYDIPEYNDTIFFINTFTTFENGYSYLLSKDYFTQKRKIYYHLEHNSSIHNFKEFYKSLFEWCEEMGIDEIWSMELDNTSIMSFNCNNIPIRFMPMRYTSLIENKVNVYRKDIDLCFIGILSGIYSPHRIEFMENYILNTDCDITIKILNGKSINEFLDEINVCKFVLDLPRYNDSTQNQVRIFEHICLGHHVMSEKCELNYFPELITEWNDIYDLENLIHTTEPQDFSEKYRKLTYSDSDYEEYKCNIQKNIKHS